MKKLMILIIPLLTLTLFGCSDDNGYEPLPQMSIRVDPARVEASAGQSFDLEIYVEDVTDLFGITFEVAFDSTVVQCETPAATAGPFMGDSPLFLSVGDSGRVSMGLSLIQTESADGISGSGLLATVHLKALSANMSPLLLQNVQMIRDDGAAIIGLNNLFEVQ